MLNQMDTKQAFGHLLNLLEQDRSGKALQILKITPAFVRVYRQRWKVSQLKPKDKKGKKGISEKKMVEMLKKAGVQHIPEHWKFPKELK